jgi:hypothetical protein
MSSEFETIGFMGLLLGRGDPEVFGSRVVQTPILSDDEIRQEAKWAGTYYPDPHAPHVPVNLMRAFFLKDAPDTGMVLAHLLLERIQQVKPGCKGFVIYASLNEAEDDIEIDSVMVASTKEGLSIEEARKTTFETFKAIHMDALNAALSTVDCTGKAVQIEIPRH